MQAVRRDEHVDSNDAKVEMRMDHAAVPAAWATRWEFTKTLVHLARRHNDDTFGRTLNGTAFDMDVAAGW
jgi:HD-like signal output (HDOD) protein